MKAGLAESARRVTGYIRARELMSNTDPEVISDIAIMPPGSTEPMEFRLVVGDLEALAAHAVGATPEEQESPTKYGGCPVLGCGYKIEDDMLPERPVANFGDRANAVVNTLADTAEELVVAALIAHHVVDHTTVELMDTITHLRSQLRFQAVALPEGADAEIVASKELESLRAASAQLDALHAAGVDNWEGYAEARSGQ